MATLLLAELGRAGPPPFTLRQPSSPALIEVTRRLALDRSGRGDFARLARSVGLSVRTLERRFQTETGLTPGRWLQQHKLLKGLELIAAGSMVKTAAAEAGFRTSSAYIAAFGKLFGMTPSRFFDAA